LAQAACAAWSLLAVAGGLLRGGRSALLALIPDPTAGTAAAATAATMTAFLLLLSVAGAGIGAIGGNQLFRIIRLLVRRGRPLRVAAIVTGVLLSAIGVLLFAVALALRVLVALLLAGILVLAHLAVTMTALLIVTAVLWRLVAAMAMAGERSREALAYVLHIDVGDRDFASADSRALALVLRRNDPIVVIGMLQEVLRGNAVTGSAGIACELKILLEDLIGIAADPDVGAGAGAIE